MRGSRKFCQSGLTLTTFFFRWWGVEGSKYHYKQAIIGLPVSLACQWWPNIECWLGSFVIFQGIRTSIAKKPYIVVIFQVGTDPLSPSGSAHASVCLSHIPFSYCVSGKVFGVCGSIACIIELQGKSVACPEGVHRSSLEPPPRPPFLFKHLWK